MKKIIIISILVIVLILAGLIAYRFLSSGGEVTLGESIADVLPFGSGEDFANIPSAPYENNPDNPLGADSGSLVSGETNLLRLSDTPVAGAVAFSRNSLNIVRYIDRATGHITDAILPTGTTTSAVEKVRVTNNTLPKIYEAYFKNDGSGLLIRSLLDDSDVIENTALVLTPPTPATTTEFYSVSATPLRGGLDSVTISSGNNIFYVLKDSKAIVTSTLTGTNSRNLFTSEFTNWEIARSGTNLVIYTKPSSLASGYAYSLNTSSGAYAKIVGPLNALMVVPNSSGTRYLYSYFEDGLSKLVARTSSTLAKKCVWSAREVDVIFCGSPIDEIGANEPDNWYKGQTQFSDRLWKFNIRLQTAEVLVEPTKTFGIDVDVIKPTLSPDESYLIFTNKRDLTLWALRLR
jgi:hypothetical protein